ncbi:unnamed protein product [Adineta ricciae]|uniref:Uncharacterized protein n=1 Tax=Adineta ricciae TaxID=249248 RepID=A0A815BH54_ADIRI|nr:unnamed protein product [Adineta ricciae]
MPLCVPFILATTTTVILSTYSDSLSSASPVFIRPHATVAGYYHYQALQFTVQTDGTYTFTSNSPWDTYICLYDNPVDPSYPYQNLITCEDKSGESDESQIDVYLQFAQTYVLIVTTYQIDWTRRFTINAVGPEYLRITSLTPSTSRPMEITSTMPPPVISTFSSSLSSNSPIFYRPHFFNYHFYFYYEALRVTTDTNGTYIFASSSLIDTYGCLYHDHVDLLYPYRNLIICGDKMYGVPDFRINVTLQRVQTIFLIVTTYWPNHTGDFKISVDGPDNVNFKSIAPPTHEPIITSTPTSVIMFSTYTGLLSYDTPIFFGFNRTGDDYYFYEMIQVKVVRNGNYTFTSDSYLSTYGCFYKNSYSPLNFSQNLITCDDDGGRDQGFQINITLQHQEVYVLMVTTHTAGTMGAFSVKAVGPGFIDLTTYVLPTSTSTATTTTTSPAILSTYFDNFSSNSPVFARPNGASDSAYYYQTLQVTAFATDTYTFTSDSSWDTYGCFYNNSFDPSNPFVNLIACDDDTAGKKQFRMTLTMQYEHMYVLMVTTYSPCIKGSFSIQTSGPDFVRFLLLTPSSNKSFSALVSSCSRETTYQIGYHYSPEDVRTFMIVLSIWLGIFCICGICIYRYKCQRNRYQPPALSAHALKLKKIPFHESNNNDSTRIPYSISLPTTPIRRPEGLPPNYETALSCIGEQKQRNLTHF